MYRLKKHGRAAVIIPDGFLFGTDNAKATIKKKLLEKFNLHTVVRMPHDVFAPYTNITTNILFFDREGKTAETWFYRLDMLSGFPHEENEILPPDVLIKEYFEKKEKLDAKIKSVLKQITNLLNQD
jgi:type I restriction-modification system DNA methylase subunit